MSEPGGNGPQPAAAAGLTVQARGAAGRAASAAAAGLAAEGVPAALAAGDPTLWGPQAEREASIRLGWLNAAKVSADLPGEIAELAARAHADGLDRVVLAGMGGSSLAPEVIARTAGKPLVILDTTDPHQVAAAITDRPERTLVVVSSKSGTTIETDSHRRIYERVFRDLGLTSEQAARRFVVVTDPGSPLESSADADGYHVVRADPNVGGRYSALTAFGLVPSGLAGADVARLLDEAAAMAPHLGDAEGPAARLGAALGGYAGAGHDKAVLADLGSGIAGFGDWAEQLIAESTGKQGKGILPVVVEGGGAPGFSPAPDSHLIVLHAPGQPPEAGQAWDSAVGGPLGAAFLVWEYAIALAGRLIGINPFDQPNVAESKENTARLLEEAGTGPLPSGDPAFTDGAVEVHGDADVLGGAGDLGGALRALLAAVPATGYLAVMAYLDRHSDSAAAEIRAALAARTAHPVTFGWGPRFLHSTGQYHKGGPQTGVFLQITGATGRDVEVPGRPYTLGRLQLAQALGDLGALSKRGRPVLRLQLRDRAAGITQLLAAAREAGTR
jgi:glucose-6-phosphate isomerase